MLMIASDINVGTKGGGRIMKIKDLIKKLQELDGEKTIGIYDYEEDEEVLDLYVHKNIYPDVKCDYLIE